MLQAIAKLIDFDPNIFDHGAIIEDFTHKFARSWVNIDGEYYRINALYQDDDDNYKLKCSDIDDDIQYIQVNRIRKITPFMPETGLYKSKYGLVYLSRVPARQWLKSYAEGKNYKLTPLAHGIGDGLPNTRNTILDPASEFHRETMIDSSNQIWLHWRRVGTLDRHTIYLDNDKFLKEITELWPQYQITSGAKPQPAQRVEKLILDF